MRLSTAALLLLLASCLSPGHGILEANYTNLKCRCISMFSTFIHPGIIERVQITPPGNGCPKYEAVIWTKSKKVLCVNPYAKWFQKILRLFRSKVMPSTPVAPVNKRRAV
ncbi:C-X-C motif chemokine 13 isoform X2 [Meriones unguiculatus]|uniref:C-X-C motif chemokine 13 isoform X2 n=1 Tax=Meriones unguiculatus TaxID=10047 RepID=UPI000B4EE828|nr:C-X-C motif chemokine 13 isoform X2 [Meriones unguiculatus]